MQVLSKFLLIFSVMIGGLFLIPSGTAFADSPKCTSVVGPDGKWYGEGEDITSGTGSTEAPKECKDGANDLMGKILRYVQILSGLVIVAAVAMIIYAGFKYISSQGDPKQTEGAKQQLWYSGVGLFIVLTAFTILKLFQNASGFGS